MSNGHPERENPTSESQSIRKCMRLPLHPLNLLSHSKLKWWLEDQDPQQRKQHEEVEEKGKDNT